MTGLTIPTFKNITHSITNFVKDSTSVVGAESSQELQSYIQHFYLLLASFYKTNKLKMNSDKTIMIMIKNKDNSIKLVPDKNENIECNKQLKILGWWSNEMNNMSTHLMRTKSIIHHQAFILKPTLKYLYLKQRKEIINSKILSKLKYGLSFYVGQKD